MFPMVYLTIWKHWADNSLAPNRRQAIIWTNDGKFADAYIYASFAFNELNNFASKLIF